ncbi:ketopantoate reductase family protein [Verrucomicrobium spinosum]|uniref:ketopantoate reductase family protein n=1 Tax=Verrucomicrobium spinosum TaxID=2736 RepID=UPI00017446B7|nr:2-dehydropantoate 2-reductase N-terminal domain-containing protein [Verrucomicrobium spinosum]
MEPIYVIGCGAVGVPLMACLAAAGRRVVGVRASEEDAPEQTVTVPVTVDDQALDLPLQTVGIGRLGEIKGPVVIATKAHANVALARRLAPRVSGPVVIMQNGLGVERPFVEAGFQEIYRSVLYVVSEGDLKKGFRFRAVTPSPVGVVTGTKERLQSCLAALHTVGFPLRAEADIQREAWTKTIINCVFNAVCPLLEVDNSLFSKHEEARDPGAEDRHGGRHSGEPAGHPRGGGGPHGAGAGDQRQLHPGHLHSAGPAGEPGDGD